MEKLAKTDGAEMAAAAQTILREYGATRWPTLNHKGRISRLAGHLRWGFRRVRSLYNNEVGVRLRADEMAVLEGLRAEKLEEAKNARAQANRAFEERIARLEGELADLRSLLAGAAMARGGEQDGRPR